jgi:hypothetical protein
VAAGQQMIDRGPRPAEVVEQHAVGLDPVRRPVEEHDRDLVAGEIGVVTRGGDEQQRVDAAAQ